MTAFRSLAPVCMLLLLSGAGSQATWSIGVLDPRTRAIGVAAASCSPSVYGVSGVIPGKGLVFAQAASNMEARAWAMSAMRRGVSNAEILRHITSAAFDAGAALQQYALLTFQEISAPVTFTGDGTPSWHGVFSGNAITAQGNTLVSREVLRSAHDSLAKSTWTTEADLALALVRALAAGSAAGGDSRCGASTASSAFVTVFRPKDSERSPFLNVVVRRSDAGGENAVTVLARRLTEHLSGTTK